MCDLFVTIRHSREIVNKNHKIDGILDTYNSVNFTLKALYFERVILVILIQGLANTNS